MEASTTRAEPPAIAGGRRLRVSIAPTVLGVAMVMLVGAVFRLAPALVASFPLHDGGMFVVAIRDIREAGSLPATLSYNSAGIPFDYPPLAFLVAAVLPFDPLTIVHFAGPITAMVTIHLLYLIALEVLPGRPYAYLAALLYAVIPRGWDWLVAGGSLTRTPGLVFAMVAIWQLLVLYRTMRWRNAAVAGVFGGLSVLTHPEGALFFGMTFALLVALRVRDRGATSRSILVAAGAFALVLPWLGYVASQGRLSDFLAAGSTGMDPAATLVASTTWSIADEVLAPVVMALGLLGVLVLAYRRSWFLPLWLLAEVVLAARGAPTLACVPLTLAAAVGIYDGIGQGVLRVKRRDLLRSNAIRGVIVLTLWWTAFNNLGLVALKVPPFDSLQPSAVSTMNWLVSNTPPDASFAVVSGQRWPNDVYGEWLPALSDRTSLATVQGFEWKGRALWDHRVSAYDELQKCTKANASCVASWMKANGGSVDGYVYVADNDLSSALMASVKASPDFEVIHDGDDGVVAKLIAPPNAMQPRSAHVGSVAQLGKSGPPDNLLSGRQ